MVGYGLMIEDLKQRKPIKVILDGLELGIYKYNSQKEKYEGFGYLTLDSIKKILKGELNHIRIDRV